MNQLVAIDLETGKAVWELGSKRDQSDLHGSYFLGPPLPLGGKLYVLTEKNQDLRLVCLDTAKDPNKENPVVWIQTLAATRNKATTLFSIAAMHLDYLLRTYSDQDLVIMCDRQGGRGHYGALLRLMFDEWSLEIISETEARSLMSISSKEPA